MKQLIIAAAFVLTATSGALAQYVWCPRLRLLRCRARLQLCGHGMPGYGYYGGAPGYGYDRSPPAWYENNTERGGPGPRVGAGSGMGVGSQR